MSARESWGANEKEERSEGKKKDTKGQIERTSKTKEKTGLKSKEHQEHKKTLKKTTKIKTSKRTYEKKDTSPHGGSFLDSDLLSTSWRRPWILPRSHLEQCAGPSLPFVPL